MVKHTQTIRRQKPTNGLSVFDHFVRLTLKGPSVTLRLLLKPSKPAFLDQSQEYHGTRTICETCSKLTMKKPEWGHYKSFFCFYY